MCAIVARLSCSFRKMISPTVRTLAVLNLISQVQCVIDKPQRIQIWQIFWKIDFESNCQKLTTLPDTESPPKYFLKNLENPRLMPKATCPSSPRLSRLENLGTRGEGHELSTPACPIKDWPLPIMI